MKSKHVCVFDAVITCTPAHYIVWNRLIERPNERVSERMVTIKNVTVYISLAMEHVKFVEILLFELVSPTKFSVCFYLRWFRVCLWCSRCWIHRTIVDSISMKQIIPEFRVEHFSKKKKNACTWLFFLLSHCKQRQMCTSSSLLHLRCVHLAVVTAITNSSTIIIVATAAADAAAAVAEIQKC